jgi:uncharacterized protein (TIGR02996 family)
LNDESAFLKALQERPDDEVTRLVYADWLQERGDPRGEFLRLQCSLAGLTPKDESHARHRARLQELARDIDPGWLALVGTPGIENCRRVEFEFECPLKWEKLQPTDDPAKRFCSTCRKHVFYCETIREARRRALGGQCVAVDWRVERKGTDLMRRRDLRRRPPRRMGRVRL